MTDRLRKTSAPFVGHRSSVIRRPRSSVIGHRSSVAIQQHVQAKLLRAVWNEGFAPALALVDKPQILSRLRTAFPQAADHYAPNNWHRSRRFRLCDWPHPASVPAASAYRTKG